MRVLAPAVMSLFACSFQAEAAELVGSFTDYSHETVESCIAAIRKKPVPVAEVATAAPTTSPAAGGCRIKGNISGSGHIYHVPGSASYNATRIDTSKGERWFCSEEEAEAAGWRAPRG